MRFFDRKKHTKATSSSYDQKVVLFPSNHFHASPDAVKELQKKLELRDAQQFKNSVAALVQSKKTSNSSASLFAAPKPKPRAPQLKLENNIKPRF